MGSAGLAVVPMRLLGGELGEVGDPCAITDEIILAGWLDLGHNVRTILPATIVLLSVRATNTIILANTATITSDSTISYESKNYIDDAPTIIRLSGVACESAIGYCRCTIPVSISAASVSCGISGEIAIGYSRCCAVSV